MPRAVPCPSRHSPTPDREHQDHELLRRWHDHGDLEARELVTARFLPLVRSIAGRYRDSGEDLDDLVQVGALGLVKAIERFDPGAGSRFVSYAVPTIAGEIKRHFRDHTWAVRVPRPVQELGLRAQRVRRETVERTGREPSREELGACLGVSAAEVAEADVGMQAYRVDSLDHDPSGAPGTPPAVVDPGYGEVEDRDLIDWVADRLDDRSRCFVEARWVDDLVQREIAEDHGVSAILVSRVLSRALAEMQERAASLGADAVSGRSVAAA